MRVPVAERLVPLAQRPLTGFAPGYFDGMAATDEFAESLWSFDPEIRTAIPAFDGEPRSALFTCYAPPHPCALTQGACDFLLKLANEGVEDRPSVRVRWLTDEFVDDPDVDAICAWMHDVIAGANTAWFGLDLDGFALRLLSYPRGARFREHQDAHPGRMTQKLAVSIALNDDYEGGELEVRVKHNRHLEMPRTPGTVVAYPGWTAHRVLPVTRGRRHVLIAFAYGPALR